MSIFAKLLVPVLMFILPVNIASVAVVPDSIILVPLLLNTSPVKSDVIIVAAKLPPTSLATIVPNVFASVALDVTVNTPPSAASAPLRPTPATAPSPTKLPTV